MCELYIVRAIRFSHFSTGFSWKTQIKSYFSKKKFFLRKILFISDIFLGKIIGFRMVYQKPSRANCVGLCMPHMSVRTFLYIARRKGRHTTQGVREHDHTRKAHYVLRDRRRRVCVCVCLVLNTKILGRKKPHSRRPSRCPYIYAATHNIGASVCVCV